MCTRLQENLNKNKNYFIHKCVINLSLQFGIKIITIFEKEVAGEKKKIKGFKKINKTAKMFNCVSKEHSVVGKGTALKSGV